MKATVNGVSVDLTPEQEKQVLDEIRKRDRAINAERNSFEKTLKSFGFTKIKDCAGAFEHKKMGYFAEVQFCGMCGSAWMIGEGLKHSSGFPGGWVYWSAKELADELINSGRVQPRNRKEEHEEVK